MSLTQKVAHNTIIQILGKGVSLLLGVLAIAMMTRYLGQEGFGRFTTVTVYLQFFGIVVDMGLTLMTMQLLSEPKTDQKTIFQNLLGLRLVSAIMFLGLAPLLALFFPYDHDVRIGITLTTISFLCIALNQIFIGFFQKELRSDLIMLSEIIGRVVLVAGVGIGVIMNGGLIAILLATVLGSIANLSVNILTSRREIAFGFRFDWAVWKHILERSWPIALSIFFNLIYFKADTIILSLLRSPEDVGIYGAPYRVLEVLIAFPFLFMGLVFPILNRAHAEGNATSFHEGVQKTFDALVIMTLPLVAGTVLLARPLMGAVAGEPFLVSGAPLRVLIIATGIIFVNSLFGHLVVVFQKQKHMIVWYAVTALVALLGYAIFIPRYSYMGAAWMTVVSEAMIMLANIVLIARTAPLHLSYTTLLKSLCASLFMVAVLLPLMSSPLLLLVILGMFLYGGVLYGIGGIQKETLRSIFIKP